METNVILEIFKTGVIKDETIMNRTQNTKK